LTRCAGLGDGALASLAASPAAGALEELVLYADAQFGPRALRGVLAACAPALRRLDLCGAAGATDDALGALAQHAAATADGLQLRVLNLTWCTKLTDAGAAPLLAACPRLRWLSLHGLTQIGPATLEALVRAAAGTLETLDVRGCTGIEASARTPAALRSRMPRLRVFVVHS
jgi:F-box/leucine-rich repeat protein 2/20